MNTPVLDARDAQEVTEQLIQRAASYTPEWRFDPQDMDAGGALAVLFSRMFAQTIERYNAMLYKDYIEFLNLLAVRQKAVTPAQGYVAIQIAQGTALPVEIACDTGFYHDAKDGTRVNYLSDEPIFATDARISQLVTVDPVRDAIARRDQDTQDAFPLFYVPQDKNEQCHCFELCQDEVMKLSRPCSIAVVVGETSQYLAQETVKRLAQSDFAQWSYFDGTQYRTFDRVVAQGEQVLLYNDSDAPICPQQDTQDGEGVCGIRCTMHKSMDNTALHVRTVSVSSAYQSDVRQSCDAAYANDIAIDTQNGGYCFNEQMMMYDCFYIASDEVLCKREAHVTVKLDMTTMVRKADAQQAMYEFKDKYIIDKDHTPPEPEKKYISKVVWEYWNGMGWTHLPVSGDINPFGQAGDGEKRVTFALPKDVAKTYVASLERYWVRTRVVFVENAFDLYATLLLPFVKNVELTYKYQKPLVVQKVRTLNNLVSTLYMGEVGKEMGATLYAPLPDERPALYICFDAPVSGYPVSFYFEMQGRLKEKRHLQFSAWTGRVFEPIKTESSTEGFAHSQVMRLLLPKTLQKTTLYGQQGWFVRVQQMKAPKDAPYPMLERIIPNCVRVTQRQIAADLYFSTDIHDAGKRLQLDEVPVLEAEVWVDELDSLSAQARDLLMECAPDNVHIEYTGDLVMRSFFVKWNRCEALALCSPQERVYEMDAEAGRITFGDGVHGAIPPAGEDNLRVSYSFGGGSQGNIDAEKITGITTTQAGITKAHNFLPLCGGNDAQSIALVERLGPMRLRHRGRAVTTADFEALVLEEFSQVRAVKCFANIDFSGAQRAGHVTVVILTDGYQNEPHTMAMCEKIEKYLKLRCDSALAMRGLHVIPAQVMTVNVTATVELDALEFAAQTERAILETLYTLLTPVHGLDVSTIGALPGLAQVYGTLRKVKHVQAVRDVLLEGTYFDYNISRAVALDASKIYPFAVPHSGLHTIRM